MHEAQLSELDCTQKAFSSSAKRGDVGSGGGSGSGRMRRREQKISAEGYEYRAPPARPSVPGRIRKRPSPQPNWERKQSRDLARRHFCEQKGHKKYTLLHNVLCRCSLFRLRRVSAVLEWVPHAHTYLLPFPMPAPPPPLLLLLLSILKDGLHRCLRMTSLAPPPPPSPPLPRPTPPLSSAAPPPPPPPHSLISERGSSSVRQLGRLNGSAATTFAL